MIFHSFISFTAFALAGGVCGFPSSHVIIGYRTVHPDQAARYEDAGGTLTPDDNRIATQIGNGVYTTPKLGGWPGSVANYDCVIMANADELGRLPKAWIPRTHWYKSADIDQYIKSLDASWEPAKTLRMSIISGSAEKGLQMVIPQDLLKSPESWRLNVQTKCSQNAAKLPDATVDYSVWQNVKGVKELPEEIEAYAIGNEAKEASKLAKEAVTDVTEAATAETIDAAVKKATDAVSQAIDATKRVAQMLQKHNWIGTEAFDIAWGATVDTRKSATSVSKIVDGKLLTSQKRLIEAAGEGLDTATPSVLEEKFSTAIRAFYELEKLVVKAKKELTDKITIKEQAQNVLNAGDTTLELPGLAYIWINPDREGKRVALRREVKALDSEIEVLQEKVTEFEHEVISTAVIVHRVQEATARKNMNRVEKQTQGNGRNEEEASKKKETPQKEAPKKSKTHKKVLRMAGKMKKAMVQKVERVESSSTTGSIVKWAAAVASSAIGALAPSYWATRAARALGVQGEAGGILGGEGTGSALPGLQAAETIPVAAEEVDALLQAIAQEVAHEAETSVKVAVKALAERFVVRRQLSGGLSHVDRRADDTRQRQAQQIAEQMVKAAFKQGVAQARAKI